MERSAKIAATSSRAVPGLLSEVADASGSRATVMLHEGREVGRRRRRWQRRRYRRLRRRWRARVAGPQGSSSVVVGDKAALTERLLPLRAQAAEQAEADRSRDTWWDGESLIGCTPLGQDTESPASLPSVTFTADGQTAHHTPGEGASSITWRALSAE